MDKLHITIYKKIKNNGVQDKDIKTAERIVKNYYKLCDDLIKKYGAVEYTYLSYNGTSNEEREKCKNADCMHHIEQIWFAENLNPKLSTSEMYKNGVDKVTIAIARNEYFADRMTRFAEWQKPEYLVWCSKEEHKMLHQLIKEYRKLWNVTLN